MLKIKRSFLFSLALAFSGIAAAMTEGPAPSCPVPTLDRSRTLDPAQPHGKATYVDFWVSWCGPCAASFPFMNELHKELKAQGLEVIAVNLDEEPEAAADFLKKFPANFTVASDPEGKCPALYDVKAMPTSYIIDRHGNIRHVHLGFRDSDKAEIRKQVQALLSER
jgi:thiol-disulfide isomerase/thioredoxin